MSFDPVLIWFLVGLALILSEFMLPGVILVFFGFGAWLAAITTWLGLTPGWTSQLLMFAISSVLLLVPLRRWFRARFFGYVGGDQNPEDNLDDLAGHEVVVKTAIVPGKDGQVEYKGATWSARSESNLTAGDAACIVRADGITLVVRPRD
jgi:membrane protein implicated in regulation of membrane protease activity